jgi:uncharacterized LabA/DUF88 family protein
VCWSCPDVFIPRGRTSGGARHQASRREAALPFYPLMKTIVYVDGLNLYYAALRGTAFKWLDLYALFKDHLLEQETELFQVRYYTAPAKGSSSDDPESPYRQRRYLHALKAYRGNRIEIVHGFIARTTPFLRLVRSDKPGPGIAKAQVFQFTEKQTDVNLAADLISDAWHTRCRQAVVCSNDSDLVGALAAVRRDHPSMILGLVSTARDPSRVSRELRRQAVWCKILEAAHLAQAQLPDKIPGTRLSRPPEWSGGEERRVGSITEPALLPPTAA